MECSYCQKPNPQNIFHQTKYWNVIIADDQIYLGRCIVALKRHAESLSKLKKEEWEDFASLAKKLESALKKSFDTTMFNWTCLMNNAYKTKDPNPHIHWHFRPRYNHNVKFAGLIFEDLEFAHHYDTAKKRVVSPDVRKKIADEIKKNL